MKRLYSILLMLIPALVWGQSKQESAAIADKWKEIDRLISILNYEQTKPLLADVKAYALKYKDEPMFVKAFFAESTTLRINNKEEEFFELGQKHFETTIEQTKSTLIKSILTNFYAQYLESNIYFELSETKNIFLQKNRKDKLKQIDSLYALSLKEQQILLKEPLTDWIRILSPQDNSSLSPTLYHYLSYAYLTYLATNEAENLEKRQVLIDELLKRSREMNANDAVSYLLSKKIDPNSINSNEKFEKVYLDIINSNKSDYNAYLYFEIASAYLSGDNTARALSIIEKAKAEYPKSKWINVVKNLETNILRPEISVSHKRLEPAGLYSPFKLNYKNLKTLYIRVYETTNTPDNLTEYKVIRDSLSQLVSTNGKLINEDQLSLDKFQDYNHHSTIYKLNPLAYGKYIVLYSNNADFKDDGILSKVIHSEIQISDLLFANTQTLESDSKHIYKTLILNKKSGLPYRNRQLSFYSRPIGASKAKLIQTLKTDKNGVMEYESEDKTNTIDYDLFAIYLPEEKQLIDYGSFKYYNDYYRSDEQDDEPKIAAQTLSDRRIYRPGQEVFFKSIIYLQDPQHGKTLANEFVEVRLIDANGQKVDSLQLKSNAYGSVNGKLKIPSVTLNGNFTIVVVHKKSDIDYRYIQVEEYKRPTFKVTLDTIRETYSKRDTLEIRGKALMLSGAPLIDATVNYKINASAYARRYRNFMLRDSSSRTDSDGNFVIKVPLSDTALTEFDNFNLGFSIDVVNQTGEMQTAAASYIYSSKPWILSIETVSPTFEGKWNNLRISSKNQNGQFLPMKGQVKIYKQTAGNKAISSSFIQYFNEVEYLALSDQEYERYFPNYFDPSTLSKSVRKELIATYDFNTAASDLIKLDSQLYSRGIYEIVASSVQGEDSISAHHTVWVVDKKTKEYSDHSFFSAYLDKTVYDIGDRVTIHVESKKKDAKNVVLVSFVGNKMGTPIHLPLKEGKANYSYTINASNINPPLRWTAIFMNDNQLEYKELEANIKRTDKEIVIKTRTFRDKLSPGTKEKWSFSLTSKQGGLESEVLASMYDASLNQFSENNFPKEFQLNYRYYGNNLRYILNTFNQETQASQSFPNLLAFPYQGNELPTLINYYFWNNPLIHFPSPMLYGNERMVFEAAAGIPGVASLDSQQKNSLSPMQRKKVEGSVTGTTKGFEGSDVEVTTPQPSVNLALVTARANLKETAFFLPTLYTDAQGNVTFEFDTPEALTQWKLMLFAHGKNLEAGTASFYTQTQKQLMVRPNLPRYLREGDEIIIKAQIQSLSDEEQSGQAKIAFINPVDNKDVSDLFLQEDLIKRFRIAKKSNQIVEWRIKVPAEYASIQVKIIGASEEFSDGEIQELAILPNKVLILESQKVALKGNESKTFPLEVSGKDNLMAKIQVQSNPILEIISALDYLNQYPYECTEQSSSRWFGLKMVQYIGNHYPAIAEYFKKIKANETKSRLEANEALHELKMQEMPWLRDIQGDEKKLHALAALFNSNIQSDINLLENKLAKAQLSNGAFPWFEGGNADTHISIRILEIVGKVLYLDKSLVNADLQAQMKRLTTYLDADTTIFEEKASAELALDYLYARHLWNGYFKLAKDISDQLNKKIAKAPLLTAAGPAGYAAKAWVVNQLYGASKEANELKNRIQQEAIFDKDKGTYWPSNDRYNDISLHSYMIEAYKSYDPSKLMEISQWLYYKKESNAWRSTWMTVDAIYALLYTNNPQDFAMENTVQVLVDQQAVGMEQASLGQVSKIFNKEELGQKNRSIQINNNNDRTIYGGIYHQYFLPVEAIKSNAHELKVSKEYLVERNGKWIATKEAKLGERIRVRIKIINDKNLAYVHLKDSRPSGVEPVYQASGYQWARPYRWSAGYYFTLKDASTNYFFDSLAKGVREVEYEVKANNVGVFNSGITTLECMYDPTVNSRSANIQLIIVE